MRPDANRMLRELERLKHDYGPGPAARKQELLDGLARARLSSAAAVLRLHEALCFVRAFPETPSLRRTAGRMLGRFHERADLARVRRRLADTGIGGTELRFRFYWLTAVWLVRQGFGPYLTIDWREFERREELTRLWHLLLPYTETPALDGLGFEPEEWVRRMKRPAETDAEFVIRRFEALPVPVPVREKLYEDLDIPMVLSPGARTPARGREHWPAPVVYRKEALPADRPDLVALVRSTRPKVRRVGAREGRRLIDLANACMVPRHRDLLVFLNADPGDVSLVDVGDGLQFACMGAVPERRLLLEAVYGFLTLMNGVPIGYVLCSAFYRSSEIAYNVFESFRGRGAAHVYGRVLGMVHRLFGADSFAVDPYQLGHGNEEGQESGAWWFYYKLGFRPRAPRIRALVRKELARMKRNPAYRSSPRRIDELAAEYMFLQLGPARDDVLGQLPLGEMGLAAQGYLARRFGADREGGIATCAAEAAALCGVRSTRGWSPGERLAWERWAPLVMALPGVRRFSPAERAALARVVRAKGGPRESEYVRRFDRHPKLGRALLAAAARVD